MIISDLIKQLQAVKQDCGDVPVVLSSDSEGNSYGTTDTQSSLTYAVDNKGNVVGIVLYPFADGYENADEACLSEYAKH